MTPREAADDYARRFAEMSANRDRDALNIALEVKALVQLRIQTTGQNFDEVLFSPYTAQYAKNRQKAGYQTEYVDFTRSGNLWANVRPEVIESTEVKSVVEITARDDRNQVKLQGAVKKRGNILLVSQSEADLIAQLNQQRVQRYFR
jgi:S-adenosylmethionine hydrolase